MALEDEQQLTKTIKMWHSSSSESFPTEIFFEILSRLPVESLLRCKSVCKSWRSLISDPHFIKDHLTLSTNNHHCTHHHLLLVCRTGRVSNLKTCPIYDVMYDPIYDVLYDHHHINPFELDYPMKDFGKTVSFVGSCNGLICIAIESNNLFIWNPSTRKSIKIPARPRRGWVMLRGFGYVESSDDYKVVEVTHSINKVVMIYSSGSRKWKEIGDFAHRFWLRDLNDSIVFLKGAFHWIAREDSGSYIIVSLDLAKETCGDVLLPVDEDVYIDLKLGILGDCLCVLCDYRRKSRLCVDIWVMKVYGVKDSWFKLASIPYRPVTFVENYYRVDKFSAPLCASDDGKVLLLFGLSLVVFDSKNDSVLEIQKFDGCYQAFTFVESLVSPPGHENLV